MELLNRNRLVIVSPRRTPPKASGGPARRGFYTFRSFCKDGGGEEDDEDEEEKDDDREDKETRSDKARGRRGKTGRRLRSGRGKGGQEKKGIDVKSKPNVRAIGTRAPGRG
ncbi:dr1-associated corepressor homolog [Nycticebus coucang]|uniref:dr1-associated corepressor homolog n=1 Tax=Nycticebus coucang TaxID=9470 RepID=UPI00234C4FE0|nr:dr1-associated corepressor homolog [Nycticebus coucang]